MEKGNFSRYIKYAFGEILLVVVGILIALSINNWNENRKSANTTQLMLKAIQTENELNMSDLQFKIKDAKHVRGALVQLLSHMGPDYKSKDPFEIDSLFYEGLSITLFDPNRASYDNLSNSGNIEYIDNDSLQGRLLAWKAKLESLLNSEQTNLTNFKTIVIPHFYDKISLVHIDSVFKAGPSARGSAFIFDNREALNSMVTENILEDHVFNLNKLLSRYMIFNDELRDINELIKTELDN